jgi:hypothetical protein
VQENNDINLQEAVEAFGISFTQLKVGPLQFQRATWAAVCWLPCRSMFFWLLGALTPAANVPFCFEHM